MPKPELLKINPVEPQNIARYERYLPTAFDESLTLLEKFNKMIHYMNSIFAITNEMIEKWNEVIEWILNEGLEQAIEDKLQEWLDDGTIADIINDFLFGELTAKVDKNTADIAQLRSDLNAVLDEILSLKEAMKRIGVASADTVYQHKMMEAVFGFGGNEIFEAGDRAPQGMAYANVNGVEKVFILSRANDAESWSSTERQRITEFTLRDDGGTRAHTVFSQPLNLSHQGLSAYVENGKLYLYAGMNTGTGQNASKGFSKIEWKGASTSDANVQSFQLFGNSGSGHPFSVHHKVTTTVSEDGTYLVCTGHTEYESNTRYMFVYDRQQVEGASNPLNVQPLNFFKIDPPKYRYGHVVQDLACDGKYIYLFCGDPKPKYANIINIFSMSGYHVGFFHVDGTVADYSLSELSGHPSLGTPTQMEAEGVALRNGNLLLLFTDVWESNGEYTRRSKVVYEVNNESAGGQPVNRGYIYPESPAFHLYGSSDDLTVTFGDAFQASQYDETRQIFREMFGYHQQNEFEIYDTRDGSDNDTPFSIYVERADGRDYVALRARTNYNNGGGINIYGDDDPTVPGNIILYSHDKVTDTVWDARLQETGAWRPSTEGVQNLGTASHPWKTLYATTGTINTSDRNVKTEINPISDEVLDAWSNVNYVQYKLKDSVTRKGENARTHIGLIAQSIDEAFKEKGLNATDYGIVGFDEMEDGSVKWSIRADECQFLEMALMRREMERLKKQ